MAQEDLLRVVHPGGVAAPEPGVDVLASRHTRGDIFARACGDVLGALGYAVLQNNVQRSGREVDIRAKHKVEPGTLVIAECKAQADAVGGRDLNTFAGVVSRESGRFVNGRSETRGYFISLSGFTTTAEVQEEESPPPFPLALLGPVEIISVVEGAGIVVPYNAAATQVRLAMDSDSRLEGAIVSMHAKLIAYENGWFWLVAARLPSRGLHAVVLPDGQIAPTNFLDPAVVDDSPSVKSFIAGSSCWAPSTVGQRSTPGIALDEAALRAGYAEWLLSEIGSVGLEGMPTGPELATRTFSIDDLYVSLKATPVTPGRAVEDERLGDFAKPGQVSQSAPAVSVASLFEEVPHMAILGPPGSGKSMLVRATAFAAAQAMKVDLGAPVPLVIRCRTLAAEAASSVDSAIALAIDSVVAELDVPGAKEYLWSRVRTGDVVLLIDGLDEIGDSACRFRFAEAIRLRLARAAKSQILVTCREASFRSLASVLTPAIQPFRVADLDGPQVEELCARWFALTGVSASQEREQVVSELASEPRLKPFRSNPLLLTTLLLVLRVSGAGALPGTRLDLYEQALGLLLATWNRGAHEPLSPREALPRLGYLAVAMLKAGMATVRKDVAWRWIDQAKSELPRHLGFISESAPEFVDRIEQRSGLLRRVTRGVRIDGSDDELEFSHLTFQEYLAARAICADWIPASIGSGLAFARDNLEDPRWAQTLSLVAAIDETGSLLSAIDSDVQMDFGTFWDQEPGKSSAAWQLLVNALLEEPLVSPDDAENYLLHILQYDRESALISGVAQRLRSTKFKLLFDRALKKSLARLDADAERYAELVADIAASRWDEESLVDAFRQIDQLIREGRRDDAVDAVAVFARNCSIPTSSRSSERDAIGADTMAMAESAALSEHVSGELRWLLALGMSDLIGRQEYVLPDRIYWLFVEEWFRLGDEPGGGAFAAALLEGPERVAPSAIDSLGSELEEHLSRQMIGSGRALHRGPERACAALVLARDLARPWARPDIAEMAATFAGPSYDWKWLESFLASLGPVGQDYLEILRRSSTIDAEIPAWDPDEPAD